MSYINGVKTCPVCQKEPLVMAFKDKQILAYCTQPTCWLYDKQMTLEEWNKRDYEIHHPMYSKVREAHLTKYLKAVDEWLNSDDVLLVDNEGDEIKGATLKIETGSLLRRFIKVFSSINKMYDHTTQLTLQKIREVNIERDREVFNNELAHWTPQDWGCALGGEVGELLNKIKKLRRAAEGSMNHKSDTATIQQCAEEIADVLVYLDIIAESLGIDMEDAFIEKFNRVSTNMNSTIFLKE